MGTGGGGGGCVRVNSGGEETGGYSGDNNQPMKSSIYVYAFGSVVDGEF